jgi:hypothetical protein
MNKEDIIKELDTLKLKIMLDEDLPSDVQRYESWIDEMKGKNHKPRFWEEPFFDCTEWAKYQTLRNLVDDLYGKKNNGYDYQKNRQEIRRTIAEAVAMTLFIQKETTL